jgi:hypothetical protein
MPDCMRSLYGLAYLFSTGLFDDAGVIDMAVATGSPVHAIGA